MAVRSFASSKGCVRYPNGSVTEARRSAGASTPARRQIDDGDLARVSDPLRGADAVERPPQGDVHENEIGALVRGHGDRVLPAAAGPDEHVAALRQPPLDVGSGQAVAPHDENFRSGHQIAASRCASRMPTTRRAYPGGSAGRSPGTVNAASATALRQLLATLANICARRFRLPLPYPDDSVSLAFSQHERQWRRRRRKNTGRDRSTARKQSAVRVVQTGRTAADAVRGLHGRPAVDPRTSGSMSTGPCASTTGAPPWDAEVDGPARARVGAIFAIRPRRGSDRTSPGTTSRNRRSRPSFRRRCAAAWRRRWRPRGATSSSAPTTRRGPSSSTASSSASATPCARRSRTRSRSRSPSR